MVLAIDWTTQTGSELAASVVSIGKSLWDGDAARRTRMLSCISRYDGRNLTTLSPEAYYSSGDLTTDSEDETAVRWNLARSLVSTVTSKIAGTQQPKVSFVASNADWSTRRKGPKLDAFVSGLWGTRQEPYADIWELGTFVFRDCAVCGLGALKIWADIDAGRVVHERIFPWELLVDPQDGKYGSPGNLWHVYSMPRASLLAYYSEAAEAIRDARSYNDDASEYLSAQLNAPSSGQRVVDSVRVYEWWSLPLGPDSPGKHVIAVDGGILLEEEWKRDAFPFALIRWDREFQGWHGTSLIQEVATIDDEMNEILGRISRTVRLTSIGICWINENDSVSGELVTNDDAIVMKYSGTSKPQYDNPPPFGQEHIQYLNLLKGAEYEISGVNQMSATAQKQPGIEAASAIRLVADLQSERFSVAWKAYQSLFVEVARHDIASVRELAEDDSNFSVKWPGNGFLQTIQWSKVDLKDDLYTIQIASAPSIKGTPGDRLQTATELYASGQITGDALMAVRQYYDLPGEMDRVSRQRNVIESYMESWLDATDEQIASGFVDSGQPLFRPPLRWMKLEDALTQVADGYLQAELDGAPDLTKDLFLRWIAMADEEIQKRIARMKALQGPPPGAPPPPAMPGAPMAPGMAA